MKTVKSTAGLAAIIAVFAASATAATAPELKKSVYTRHVYSKCPASKSGEPGVVETRTCLGIAVNVFWTADDDGSVVSFGPRPTKESLELAPFMEVGDTIEWRSTKSSGGVPVAAIVRYRIGQRIGSLNQSRIVVYRLTSSASCVMAIVKEPGANDKARAVADNEAEKFSCGRDKRFER